MCFTPKSRIFHFIEAVSSGMVNWNARENEWLLLSELLQAMNYENFNDMWWTQCQEFNFCVISLHTVWATESTVLLMLPGKSSHHSSKFSNNENCYRHLLRWRWVGTTSVKSYPLNLFISDLNIMPCIYSNAKIRKVKWLFSMYLSDTTFIYSL